MKKKVLTLRETCKHRQGCWLINYLIAKCGCVKGAAKRTKNMLGFKRG